MVYHPYIAWVNTLVSLMIKCFFFFWTD